MPKSIPGVMHEYKTGMLHSGSSTGPVVKSRKQAIAIAISEQQQMRHDGLTESSRNRPGRKPIMRHG